MVCYVRYFSWNSVVIDHGHVMSYSGDGQYRNKPFANIPNAQSSLAFGHGRVPIRPCTESSQRVLSASSMPEISDRYQELDPHTAAQELYQLAVETRSAKGLRPAQVQPQGDTKRVLNLVRSLPEEFYEPQCQTPAPSRKEKVKVREKVKVIWALTVLGGADRFEEEVDKLLRPGLDLKGAEVPLNLVEKLASGLAAARHLDPVLADIANAVASRGGLASLDLRTAAQFLRVFGIFNWTPSDLLAQPCWCSLDKVSGAPLWQLGSLAWSLALLRATNSLALESVWQEICSRENLMPTLRAGEGNRLLGQIAQVVLEQRLELKCYESSLLNKQPPWTFPEFQETFETVLELWKQAEGQKREFRRATRNSLYQREVVRVLQTLGLDPVLEHQDLTTGYMIDIAVYGRGDQRLAVEVDGPSHYARNKSCLLGKSEMKDRHLGLLAGWKVVRVPHHDWEAVQGSVAQRAYLRERLGLEPPRG
eukprot:jgi/Botrbrau1/17030/Bobra.49_2s0086.1